MSDKTNQKLYRGRRLVRAALKLAMQLLDTGGLFVWEWLRGCQSWEVPEMKMFQTRSGNWLSYSDLDACELGVRDETARMQARRHGWSLKTLERTGPLFLCSLSFRCASVRFDPHRGSV